MTVNELKVKRGQLVTQMNELLAKSEMSAEDRVKFDAIDADQETLKRDIDRAEKANTLDGEMRASVPPRQSAIVAQAEPEIKQREKAFEDYFRHGLESRDYTPQTVSTTGGGYVIPTGFSGELEKTLKAFGAVANVARNLTTETGNDVNWPTLDDTSSTGELLAINTAAAAGALTFGQVTLKSWKYSSKVVLVPNELLQDTAIPLESIIAECFGERLGRITNLHFTTGNDSGKPQGVVPFAAAGKTGASASAVTFDEILDLIHAVDPAYRTACQLMFNDATLKALKKLKDGDGKPLWVAGVFTREPDTIWGYKYVINPDMADIGSAARSVIFGDFSKYIVRRVRAFQVMRLAERFAEYDQSAFLGFARFDGRGLNSAAIKYFLNAS